MAHKIIFIMRITNGSQKRTGTNDQQKKVDISVLFSSTKSTTQTRLYTAPVLSSIITLFFRIIKISLLLRVAKAGRKNRFAKKSTLRGKALTRLQVSPIVAHRFSSNLLRSLTLRSHGTFIWRVSTLRSCSLPLRIVLLRPLWAATTTPRHVHHRVFVRVPCGDRALTTKI